MAGFNVRVRDLGVRDLLRDIPGELSDALRAGLNDVSALWPQMTRHRCAMFAR
jgi:hypothetical protein